MEKSHRTGFVIKVGIHFPSLSERGPEGLKKTKRKTTYGTLSLPTEYEKALTTYLRNAAEDNPELGQSGDSACPD